MNKKDAIIIILNLIPQTFDQSRGTSTTQKWEKKKICRAAWPPITSKRQIIYFVRCSPNKQKPGQIFIILGCHCLILSRFGLSLFPLLITFLVHINRLSYIWMTTIFMFSGEERRGECKILRRWAVVVWNSLFCLISNSSSGISIQFSFDLRAF